jgi:hypothetical protein
MLGYVLKDHFFPAKKDSVPSQPYYNYAGFIKPKEPLDNADKKLGTGQSLREKNRDDYKQKQPDVSDDVEDVFDLPVKELESEYNKSGTGRAGQEGPLTEIEEEYEKFTDAESFFKNPNKYRGKEIEIDIEMIVAKNTGKGWRLNFLHQREDKGIDYIYIDDDSVLGAQPDLKIGHFYKVRFLCGGGLNAGNKLISIKPTGNKAPWATDLSAVE